MFTFAKEEKETIVVSVKQGVHLTVWWFTILKSANSTPSTSTVFRSP